MSEVIKSELIQYKRLYTKCVKQLEDLSTDDISLKTEKMAVFTIYSTKLKELQAELLQLVEENVGSLRENQIKALKDSIIQFEERVKEKQTQKPILIIRRNENLPEKEALVNRKEVKRVTQRDFETTSLHKLREELGLNRSNSGDEEDDKLHEAVMSSIMDQTGRIKTIGESIHQRITEDNKVLEETDRLTDRNINAVEERTRGIRSIQTGICSSMLRNLLLLVAVLAVFFGIIVVITLLPKPT